jgi:hypothetical protein
LTCPLALGYIGRRRPVLSGLAEHHMAAKQRIVLLDLESRRVVSLVLLGVIDVFALSAFEFDDDTIALFLRHFDPAFLAHTKQKGAEPPSTGSL